MTLDTIRAHDAREVAVDIVRPHKEHKRIRQARRGDGHRVTLAVEHIEHLTHALEQLGHILRTMLGEDTSIGIHTMVDLRIAERGIHHREAIPERKTDSRATRSLIPRLEVEGLHRGTEGLNDILARIAKRAVEVEDYQS